MSSITNPRSPGTHIVGPWVTDSIKLYRVFRTGTQYVGNWASRVRGLIQESVISSAVCFIARGALQGAGVLPCPGIGTIRPVKCLFGPSKAV